MPPPSLRVWRLRSDSTDNVFEKVSASEQGYFDCSCVYAILATQDGASADGAADGASADPTNADATLGAQSFGRFVLYTWYGGEFLWNYTDEPRRGNSAVSSAAAAFGSGFGAPVKEASKDDFVCEGMARIASNARQTVQAEGVEGRGLVECICLQGHEPFEFIRLFRGCMLVTLPLSSSGAASRGQKKIIGSAGGPLTKPWRGGEGNGLIGMFAVHVQYWTEEYEEGDENHEEMGPEHHHIHHEQQQQQYMYSACAVQVGALVPSEEQIILEDWHSHDKHGQDGAASSKGGGAGAGAVSASKQLELSFDTMDEDADNPAEEVKEEELVECTVVIPCEQPHGTEEEQDEPEPVGIRLGVPIPHEHDQEGQNRRGSTARKSSIARSVLTNKEGGDDTDAGIDVVMVFRLTRNEDGSLRRAERAGVQIGDRLLAVNGLKVTPKTVSSALATAHYPLQLTLLRARAGNRKRQLLRMRRMKRFDDLGELVEQQGRARLEHVRTRSRPKPGKKGVRALPTGGGDRRKGSVYVDMSQPALIGTLQTYGCYLLLGGSTDESGGGTTIFIWNGDKSSDLVRKVGSDCAELLRRSLTASGVGGSVEVGAQEEGMESMAFKALLSRFQHEEAAAEAAAEVAAEMLQKGEVAAVAKGRWGALKGSEKGMIFQLTPPLNLHSPPLSPTSQLSFPPHNHHTTQHPNTYQQQPKSLDPTISSSLAHSSTDITTAGKLVQKGGRVVATPKLAPKLKPGESITKQRVLGAGFGGYFRGAAAAGFGGKILDEDKHPHHHRYFHHHHHHHHRRHRHLRHMTGPKRKVAKKKRHAATKKRVKKAAHHEHADHEAGHDEEPQTRERQGSTATHRRRNTLHSSTSVHTPVAQKVQEEGDVGAAASGDWEDEGMCDIYTSGAVLFRCPQPRSSVSLVEADLMTNQASLFLSGSPIQLPIPHPYTMHGSGAATGGMLCASVGLGLLEQEGVYIVDAVDEVWIWIGGCSGCSGRLGGGGNSDHQSDISTTRTLMQLGRSFIGIAAALDGRQHGLATPLMLVHAGAEPAAFLQYFGAEPHEERAIQQDSEDLNERAQEDIVARLGKLSLLKNMAADEVKTLAKSFRVVDYPAGTIVMRQGDPIGDDSQFYFLDYGSVRCIADGVEVATLKKGSYFGEMGLMGEHPRSADVVAHTDLVCLCLSRADFQKVGDRDGSLVR
jgi:hypothetical protein